jgi:hypothetical protein
LAVDPSASDASASSVPFGRLPIRSALRRALAAGGAGLAALALASCGFDAQTNKAYTPSEGVNADVGTYQTEPAVKVRNLMILSRAEGSGFLSASLTAATTGEALTSASATALNADGSDGAALTVKLPDPVSLGSNLVVLTDRAAITVTGAMTPGYTARITLSFSKAGQLTIVAPIVDANQGPYATVSPSAAVSPAG